ncbi:MAG: helix-turn-helix domain-containing protein [Lachnospiraceae bacterium]|nr:helix-turn-helix domain-containing protein [Lachnospiraceae bacterium]
MKTTCTINELSMMTGFTTRTLRNYIRSGVLRGEKKGGVWQFSEDDIAAFCADPNVFSKIIAKRDAIVTDFLNDPMAKGNRACVILNLVQTDEEKQKTAEWFCDTVSRFSDGENIRFASYSKNDRLRLVIEGEEKTIRAIMREYDERG